MLDVHAPHKPLESVREFFLHLFTITVGLVIAVQIDSFVEWRHHVHLAQEARESLRDEIKTNLQDLKATEPELEKWRDQVRGDMDAMQRIQDHPNDPEAQKASLNIGAGGMSLRNTAWQTAQSTGALAYMPYEEARRYAEIYQAQTQLLELERVPQEDAARAFGLVARFGLKRNTHVRADQASLLNEQFGTLAFHLADITAVLHKNIEVSQAFLEGREAKGSFNESVK